MKKFSILVLFGCALLLLPQSGFAKQVCFQGVSGGNIYFEINGGKVESKPFGGHVVVENLGCRAGQWAVITTDNVGVDHITMNSTHDPFAGCLSVQSYGAGDVDTGFTINFDNGQDGTIDGSFVISPVNCNLVPLNNVTKKEGVRKEGEFGGPSKKASTGNTD